MNLDSNPLVTVVVPSFNQGQYIEDSLKSILNQDYPNIEVIVMDGGSTDLTLKVLKRYEERITYFSEPDKGQSHAINKGFRLAKGEIVAWLNSDDIYPDRRAIRKMVEAFISHPEFDLIYGDFIEIDSSNNVLKIYKRPKYSLPRLLRIGYISQPATFFRKKVIEVMPVREDLRYAMDLEYWLRASRLKFRTSSLNYLIAAERIHGDAKCVRDRNKMVAEARLVREFYGAKYDQWHQAMRFLDRLWLYILRITGIYQIIFYKSNPGNLTVPLGFDGAIARTLAVLIR